MTALNLSAEQQAELERRINAAVTTKENHAGSHWLIIAGTPMVWFHNLYQVENQMDFNRAALRRAILEGE